MSAALPIELRERIVHTYLDGEGTDDELAVRFKISSASVARYVQRDD